MVQALRITSSLLWSPSIDYLEDWLNNSGSHFENTCPNFRSRVLIFATGFSEDCTIRSTKRDFPHCLTAHAPATWPLCFWHKITNSFSSYFRSCISDSSLPVLMLTNISYFCTCCSALLGCSSDSKMYPTAEAVRPIFRSRQLWQSWRSVLASAPFSPTHFGFYLREIYLLHLSSPVLEWSMVLHRN